VVFAFIGGNDARSFRRRSPADRRNAVLSNFADFFGPEGRSARGYFESDWPGERWSRGAPVGIYGPGTMTTFGAAIRKPVRRIHWAGTETSSYWNGYMDGAVRSGERAAREVIEAL
jgi:monoamine oxidase